MSGKILITGGLGNLGSWITKEFCDQGYEVYVLTRKETYKIKNINYNVIEADITDINNLRNKLTIDFDYCIHTASFNEYFIENYYSKALDINVLGTRNLLEVLAKKNIKKFIYFSTFHVYGAKEGVVDELTELNPKNDYALTHLFAEYDVKKNCESLSLSYSIFRLTNSYGCPKNKNSDKWYLVLNDLVKSAYVNKKMTLLTNGKTSRDFIWMGDVAKITSKALEVNMLGIYNLSSMQNYTIVKLAQMIQKEYYNRYHQKIKIEVNNHDRSIYSEITISNNKLKSIIDFQLDDMISIEINKIFKLLETEN